MNMLKGEIELKSKGDILLMLRVFHICRDGVAWIGDGAADDLLLSGSVFPAALRWWCPVLVVAPFPQPIHHRSFIDNSTRSSNFTASCNHPVRSQRETTIASQYRRVLTPS
jgi:hypothetical protein